VPGEDGRNLTIRSWRGDGMDQDKQPQSKKRTVCAPQSEASSKPPAVLSVELDEDEKVEWAWTHTSDGTSVVTGYTITKK
jgi:hypothetical protein